MPKWADTDWGVMEYRYVHLVEFVRDGDWKKVVERLGKPPDKKVTQQESKCPPAKPGALRCEPLKAAYPGGFGAVSHLLRGMRHQVPKLTILKHAHLDAPLFAAA